jgi:hypothetical protein
MLGAVVQRAVLAMVHARQDLLFGCAITAEFIRDEDPWHVRQALQQLAEESLRRPVEDAGGATDWHRPARISDTNTARPRK